MGAIMGIIIRISKLQLKPPLDKSGGSKCIYQANDKLLIQEHYTLINCPFDVEILSAQVTDDPLPNLPQR